jgi:hypothetical protein
MTVLGAPSGGTATDLRDAPETDDPSTTVSPHRPELRAIIRRVALSLVVACVIPATLFYLVLIAADVWTAILAALGWSYSAIAWRAITKRRASGLLILTAAVMTGRTAIAMATDSTTLYFLQPVLSDSLVATAFLLSLASARPVVARLAGDFYPMDHELAVRPRVKRLFWYLTLMWAVMCLGKAALTLWLLYSQNLETFVLTKSISMLSLNTLAVVATIWAAAVVARREGLLSTTAAQPALIPSHA